MARLVQSWCVLRSALKYSDLRSIKFSDSTISCLMDVILVFLSGFLFRCLARLVWVMIFVLSEHGVILVFMVLGRLSCYIVNLRLRLMLYSFRMVSIAWSTCFLYIVDNGLNFNLVWVLCGCLQQLTHASVGLPLGCVCLPVTSAHMGLYQGDCRCYCCEALVEHVVKGIVIVVVDEVGEFLGRFCS